MNQFHKFTIEERVRWGDVDAASIIFYGSYIRFFEIAETELFRSVGMPYGKVFEELDIWLPRVQFHIDYRSPVKLDDLVDVEIWISRIGRSSIRFELSMKNQDGGLAAEAYLVIVAISRQDGRSVEVPALLVQALAPYRTDLQSA